MVEASKPPSTPTWYYRTWSVLLLLFLVLGPFGLPLLWRSPSFSRGMKLTLTLVVLAYSALLLEAVLTAVRLAVEQMNALARAHRAADDSCRPLFGRGCDQGPRAPIPVAMPATRWTMSRTAE